MIRRRTLASLAALAAVLAFLARVPARADEKPSPHHEMHEKCAKACFDCARDCASCFPSLSSWRACARALRTDAQRSSPVRSRRPG